MKLFWSCITAVILVIANAAVDVEKTVQQVQSILKANTLLPRLTRDEIIGLLNDIRAEDAKSNSASKEKLNKVIKNTTALKLGEFTTPTIYKNERDNKINSVIKSISNKDRDAPVSASISSKPVESTTKSSGSTLTVVLPYTPRDGSSLQELYTKPPRVQVVTERIIPKPTKSSKKEAKANESLKNKPKTTKQELDFPAELQAFLEAHGLEGTPGQDNFLLPREGFKPLPPAKIIDGNVQLPENLLLSYDLISPSDLTTSQNKDKKLAQTNFLYEPLRPENPFELDTSSSESKHTVLPLDLPKPRKTKAIPQTVNITQPNYEPIDYDAVKVIPLSQGPNPLEDEVILSVEPDQNKRQTNETSNSESVSTSTVEPTDTENDSRDSALPVPDVVASDSDTGASIADLEDSFGGAVPAQPGDSELPPPRKNGFYWMVDWNSFLEVGDGDTKVNIRFEPKLGDPQMFLPVNVP